MPQESLLSGKRSRKVRLGKFYSKGNLYPSWDAQNMNSVRLAEKLGYEFDHEYVAYEVDRT